MRWLIRNLGLCMLLCLGIAQAQQSPSVLADALAHATCPHDQSLVEGLCVTPPGTIPEDSNPSIFAIADSGIVIRVGGMMPRCDVDEREYAQVPQTSYGQVVSLEDRSNDGYASTTITLEHKGGYATINTQPAWTSALSDYSFPPGGESGQCLVADADGRWQWGAYLSNN